MTTSTTHACEQDPQVASGKNIVNHTAYSLIAMSNVYICKLVDEVPATRHHNIRHTQPRPVLPHHNSTAVPLRPTNVFLQSTHSISNTKTMTR